MRHATTLLVALAAMLFFSSSVASAGVVLWLDANDGSSVRNSANLPALDGEAVHTWVDLAGTSQDASPAVNPPVYDTSGGPLGQPVIDFNASPANGTWSPVPWRPGPW